MQNQDRPIAFFDSGLGGISVLRETVRLLPQENYLYYGDCASTSARMTLSSFSTPSRPNFER